MKVRVLGCYGSQLPGFRTCSVLVNGRLLIDAGAVAQTLSFQEQLAIDDVLLTHAHLDHVVDLAFMIDNVFFHRDKPLRIFAPRPVLNTVQEHLFNDEVWPDFTRFSSKNGRAVKLQALESGEACRVGEIEVRWAQTNHPVFTAGYCLTEGCTSLLHSGDTGATDALWSLGRCCPGLKSAFVETSFPNRLGELAEKSGHLTPAQLAKELDKLDRPDVAVKVLHMKPQFLDEILSELNDLGDGRLQVLRGGEEFVL